MRMTVCLSIGVGSRRVMELAEAAVLDDGAEVEVALGAGEVLRGDGDGLFLRTGWRCSCFTTYLQGLPARCSGGAVQVFRSALPASASTAAAP